MFIETTINIDHSLLLRIQSVSEELHLSKSSLLSLLIEKLFEREIHSANLFNRTRYQARSKKKNWHCLHVSLRCDAYEKALDLRKLSKKSVSFLISIAISKYLPDIIDQLTNSPNTDNYSPIYIFRASFSTKLDSYSIYYELEEALNYSNKPS